MQIFSLKGQGSRCEKSPQCGNVFTYERRIAGGPAPTAHEAYAIVRPTLLSARGHETLGNCMDGRISCRYSVATCFLVYLILLSSSISHVTYICNMLFANVVCASGVWTCLVSRCAVFIQLDGLLFLNESESYHLISGTVMLVVNSSSRALRLGSLCKPTQKENFKRRFTNTRFD